MIDLISKTAEELGVTNTAITNQKDILFYNVKQAPFSIHGLFDPLNTSPYRRIPESVAERRRKRTELSDSRRSCALCHRLRLRRDKNDLIRMRENVEYVPDRLLRI